MSRVSCIHDILREAHPEGLCALCDDLDQDIPEPVIRTVVPDRAQIMAAGMAAKVELSRRNLSRFVRLNWHILEPDTPLEWSWHIEAICRHVQHMLLKTIGVVKTPINNLVINVPPGSMKSLIVNVFGPAWMWTFAPHWTGCFLSGTKAVITRDARKMRKLINSPFYRSVYDITWEMSPDQDAITNFANTMGGVRRSLTAQSMIVGERYHALIYDDPNDTKDTSETKLKAVHISYMAAGNRLRDMRQACRIIIQQRTHEMDLSGHILDTRDETTEHLCIPMHYTTAKCACGVDSCDTKLGKNDPRTVEGQILHPERNTLAVVTAEAKRLGPIGAAGQLEQRPSPADGAIFKREYWRWYDELPLERTGRQTIELAIMSCDLQFKKEGTSRTCIMVVAKKGVYKYIHDIVVRKMDILETVAEIKKMYFKHVDDYLDRPLINKILIEDKANGPAVMDMLRNVLPGIVGESPKGDKIARANAVLPDVAAGNIFVRKGQSWTEDFIHECTVFPRGKYDDQVDAMVQALLDMASGFNLGHLKALCAL